MGIGGAAVYSLGLMIVRALPKLGARVARVLRWIGREALTGAAQYGANLHGLPPHAFDPRPFRRTSDDEPPSEPL